MSLRSTKTLSLCHTEFQLSQIFITPNSCNWVFEPKRTHIFCVITHVNEKTYWAVQKGGRRGGTSRGFPACSRQFVKQSAYATSCKSTSPVHTSPFCPKHRVRFCHVSFTLVMRSVYGSELQPVGTPRTFSISTHHPRGSDPLPLWRLMRVGSWGEFRVRRDATEEHSPCGRWGGRIKELLADYAEHNLCGDSLKKKN